MKVTEYIKWGLLLIDTIGLALITLTRTVKNRHVLIKQASGEAGLITNQEKFEEVFGIRLGVSAQYKGGYLFLDAPNINTEEKALKWLNGKYRA